MNLLIADDSKEISERLKQSLEEIEGVKAIRWAESVKEAQKLLRAENIDLLILDLRFPEGSGLDVLKFFNGSFKKPPIAIFTNYPYKQYKDRCMQLGADYFFAKSNEFDDLLDLVIKMTNEKAN